MKILILFSLIFFYSCSEKKNSDRKVTNHSYEKAWDYLEKKQNISAFIEFGKAKNIFIKNKDSQGAGKCLMNMAIIQEQMGDNFGSQETGLSALKFLNKLEPTNAEYLSANYNNLGISSYNLKEYETAIKFYKNAIETTTNNLDKKTYSNNLANVYKAIKNYDDAIKIYNNILKETQKNEIEHARILSNLAFTKWLQNSNFNPIPEFKKALNIRLSKNDTWGLNVSYSHIADYYIKNNHDSALIYSKKMYSVARELQSPDDQIEALQKLISLDDFQNSKNYFQVYQKLNDSLQTARSKAKNQFALIRYETEKNRADFLKAKAESTERQNKILQQYIVIVFIISLFILSTYIFWRRQKRLQQEKLLEVKNTELRYSKKVHDVVANGLYHTMIEIQNKPELDKEKILNQIEKMYEESRDIAQDEIMEKDFYSRFYKMINSYSSNHQRILPVGYKEDIWENLSDNVQSELYYIIREILVNMKKHSQAKFASLKFEKKQNHLTIKYTDNGIGISDLKSKKGTGIRNTENRIDSINGDIIFEKNPRGGLIIQITIPIHSKYV